MLVDDQKKVSDYYRALVERDPSYVGVFYVGVKTTSIFCIATCRARKPKRENVVFYSTLKDALHAGFRPCKVCRPTENANEMPEAVRQAIDLVKQQSPKEKVKDAQLREAGIAPEMVRRWFNKHYGMTFQAYQRMLRVNLAMQELKSGKTALDTALDVGYESLSGFGYMYKKYLGQSPKHNEHTNVILIHRFTTPLGPMFTCATEEGICLLEFVERRMLEKEFEDLQKRLKANIIAGENQFTKQVEQEVEEYFAGTRQYFDVPLVTPGTDFQCSVWHILKTIPYGETRSYQAQADKLGNPKAVRAVASANGMNRIAIIIPCHRVIGKNGHLTGYAGGLERKRWLLEHEQSIASK
ncbi:bifunctional transcriptional activator/DNA repair enzyme AdaA [Algicola sagamiensis]|uniref:bifunctional transcriptional activator/DNA repair enzyme AdaA n=1 Tax=Algicola sagamiensis TaxID=163869 RepID=UPI0003674ADC|nr:methylated-DNA--[protein]-cysteine S-methyltransferase [Algicola sagamiensis]